MKDLRTELETVRAGIERFATRSTLLGESNTKASLIEPVLQALGWDIRDPEEVHREYRLQSSDNPVDYGLLLNGAPVFLVEAKGLRENITDPRWANQLLGYAAVAGVPWVALTDGDTWQIYNGAASIPRSEKLFRTVRISADLNGAVSALELLRRSAESAERLNQLWIRQIADQRVADAVMKLFDSRNRPQLLAALHPHLAGVSEREALEALDRLDLHLEQRPGPSAGEPAPSSEPTSPSAPSALSPPPGPLTPKRSGKGRRTAQETRITLLDMIEAGVIAAGEPVVARYIGVTFEAEVTATGKIRFRGTDYWPSGAGTAAKRSIRPDAPQTVLATDGWDFWLMPEAPGRPRRKLADIRHDLALTREATS